MTLSAVSIFGVDWKRKRRKSPPGATGILLRLASVSGALQRLDNELQCASCG